jgi:hypothetical protein
MIPSVLGVAVVIPQKIHSVIDNGVRAWPTHEISYRVTVNDSRGCKEIPGGLVGCAVTGRCWSPLVVEIVETAKRIGKFVAQKTKKAFRVPSKAKHGGSLKHPFAIRQLIGGTDHI